MFFSTMKRFGCEIASSSEKLAIYVRIERYESYLLKDAKNIEIGDVDGKLHNN